MNKKYHFWSVKKAKMAKNRVLIFGKIMAQIRVFVGEKSIGTRFKTRRCIQIGFWINYKISQILQFFNFSIFIQNIIWMHRRVLKRVPIDFSPTKTLTWAIILPKIRTRFFAIFAFLSNQKWHFLFTVGNLIQHATSSATRESTAKFSSRFEFLSRVK